jgi:hypothetical protein
VSDFVRDVDYKAGDIVPHCGCTIDVFVGESDSVTVSDKPVEHSCALVEVLPTSNGLTCYRLALGAGHRIAVQASGWLHRIAAMEPYLYDVLEREHICRFCLNTRRAPHLKDCLWQNAVDAADPMKAGV